MTNKIHLTPFSSLPEPRQLALYYATQVMKEEQRLQKYELEAHAALSDETKAMLETEKNLQAEISELRKKIRLAKSEEIPMEIQETLARSKENLEASKSNLGLTLAELFEREELEPTHLVIGTVKDASLGRVVDLVANWTAFGGWAVSDPFAFISTIGKERATAMISSIEIKFNRDNVSESDFNTWARTELTAGTIAGLCLKPRVLANRGGNGLISTIPAAPDTTPIFTVNSLDSSDVDVYSFDPEVEA